MALKVVLLTIDRAGELLLERLVGVLPKEIDISLVITRETRHYDFNGNPVVNACDKLHINCIQPDFSKQEYLQQVATIKPDLVIISNFHKIIKKELIDIPKIGAFNLHSSLLPKMRGGTSIIWALKRGMNQTGVTLHEVTEGVDDGDIITQQTLPISFWDTQGSLYEKVTLAKFELLKDFIIAVRDGKNIEKRPQDDSKATYLPKRKDDDGLLNIQDDMKMLYDHIRSFDPWTGAYFPDLEKKVRLRSVTPVRYFIKSKVTENELILSRKSPNMIKSFVFESVTDVVERPNIYDKKLAEEVLKYWEVNN